MTANVKQVFRPGTRSPRVSQGTGLSTVATWLLLFSWLPVAAGAADSSDVIPLSDAQISTLGIQFQTVEANGPADGFEVPAQVIHSPQTLRQLSARFAGTVNQWFVQGGQRVAKGDALVALNSVDYMTAQQQWLAARHQLSKMDSDLQQDRQLFNDGIITRQRLDQSERARAAAHFQLQASARQLLMAGVTEAELQSQQTPGDYVIRAPADGIVSRFEYTVGGYVEANHTIASVSGSEALWLRAQIPVAFADQLQPGAPLQLADNPALLTLESLNRDISPTSQTLQILARFEASNTLHPGQQVVLIVPSHRYGIRVPASAVIHSNDSRYVFIRGRNGVVARELNLQPLGRDYLALSGLNSGDALAVQGSALLKGIQLGLGGDE